MPANVENSAVATGLDKASFHPNPEERHSQRNTIALAKKFIWLFLLHHMEKHEPNFVQPNLFLLYITYITVYTYITV